jgi:uncharacterized membrane protein YeaQ/YmgE (transglycosylase-associated protein family)
VGPGADAGRAASRQVLDQDLRIWTFVAPIDGELKESEASGPRSHSRTTGGIVLTSIIWAIIIGAIVGALGRLVVPGRQNLSIWLTIGIGIVAALIGTAIARALGFADTGGIDWRELAVQVILAAIGVALVSGVSGRNRV